MELKVGSTVTVKNAPDWGTGIVVKIDDSKATIHFSDTIRKVIVSALVVQPTGLASAGASKVERFENEEQLRRLTNAFFSIANKAGIEKLEQKIYDVFLDGKPGKSTVKAQLKNWVETPTDGKHEQAYPDAVALWNFLFPEAPRSAPSRKRKP